MFCKSRKYKHAFELRERIADTHLGAAAEWEVSKPRPIRVQPAIRIELFRPVEIVRISLRDVRAQNDTRFRRYTKPAEVDVFDGLLPKASAGG